MNKQKIKDISVKKASFCTHDSYSTVFGNNSAEIRLGIGIADEKAEKELNKRNLEAPLSIEEMILLSK